MRRGETRVNGSLAMDSPATGEELSDEEEFVRDDEDEEELDCEADEEVEALFVCVDRRGSVASSELREEPMAGSNVQSSHRSSVAVVRPEKLEVLKEVETTGTFVFPCDRGFRRIPTNLVFATSHPPRSQVTSTNGTRTAFLHIDCTLEFVGVIEPLRSALCIDPVLSS